MKQHQPPGPPMTLATTPEQEAEKRAQNCLAKAAYCKWLASIVIRRSRRCRLAITSACHAHPVRIRRCRITRKALTYSIESVGFALFYFRYHEFVVPGRLNPKQRCSSSQRFLRIGRCDDSEVFVAYYVDSPTWHRGLLFPGISTPPRIRHFTWSLQFGRTLQAPAAAVTTSRWSRSHVCRRGVRRERSGPCSWDGVKEEPQF